MGIKYEDNELIISHIFSKKKISYRDIKSIRVNGDYMIFTISNGEEVTEKDHFFEDKACLYAAIKRYNISYRNENELVGMEETFTRQELESMITKARDFAQKFVSQDVKLKLGDAYDIRIDISEIDEYIQMDFFLQKDGRDDPARGSFDDITLAFFVEWDTTSCCALYGVTVEMIDEDKLMEAVQYSMQYLYEEI